MNVYLNMRGARTDVIEHTELMVHIPARADKILDIDLGLGFVRIQ